MLLQDLKGRDPVDAGGFQRDRRGTAGFEPQDLNKWGARSCKSWVKVPKARIGVSALSGFTAAMCSAGPMSIAAAPGLTGFSCDRSPVIILVMMHRSIQVWAEGLGHANPSSHLNRDHHRGSVTTLKCASAHVPRF